MKRAVAALVAALVLAIGAAPARAQTTEGLRPNVGPTPDYIFCRNAADVRGPALLVPGFGEAVAQCVHNHHMSARFRACLIGAGISVAGVATGNLIVLAAAREIAASMIGAGTAACLHAFYT